MKVKIEETMRASLSDIDPDCPPSPMPRLSVLAPGLSVGAHPREHPSPGGSLPRPCQTVPLSPSPVLTQDHQALGVHLILGPVGNRGRAVGRGQQLLHQQGPHHLGAQHRPAVLGDLEDEPEETGERSLPDAAAVRGAGGGAWSSGPSQTPARDGSWGRTPTAAHAH